MPIITAYSNKKKKCIVFMTKDELFSFIKENPTYCRESYFSTKFPTFYDEIMMLHFPDDFKFSQKLYHYFRNDYKLELGLCPVCGKRCKFIKFGKGYYKHCSIDCINKDKNSIMKSRNTCIKKYGVDHYNKTDEYKNRAKNTCKMKYGVDYYSQTDEYIKKSKQTCQEKYGVDYYSQTDEYMIKYKQTCIKKYGVDHYTKTNEYKEKTKNICKELYGVEHYSQLDEVKNKMKRTCIIKYGNEWAMQNDSIKEKRQNTYKNKYNGDYSSIENKRINTCKNKYGVDYYSQTDEYKKKIYEKKKINNTFNSSKIEDDVEKYFIKENIKYIRQYKSNNYPFCCDFFLTDYDLYIEIQGSWTHGFHPFNENNIDDINKLNIWKEKSLNSNFYKNAINTWTIRDVEKRKTAVKNNIRYLEVFSIDLIYIINEIKKMLN